MRTNEHVKLRNLRLPEFENNKKLEQLDALIFDKKCRYDIILGANFLQKTGIDVLYSKGVIQWLDSEIPLRDPYKAENRELLAMADSIEVQYEDSFIGENWLDSYLAMPILDAKYEKADLPKLVSEMKHLNTRQKADVLELLEKHKNFLTEH